MIVVWTVGRILRVLDVPSTTKCNNMWILLFNNKIRY